MKPKDKIKDLEEFRKRVREQRERQWISDAIRLRDKTPEETIHMMFDMLIFAEKINRAEKCDP